ncbi:MAG: hypothetical protein ACYS8Z_20710, partial [Planctomycetota bacterium]
SKSEIKSIVASGHDLIFAFANEHRGDARSMLSKAAGKVWTTDSRTAYLQLRETYFEPKTLLGLLRKILSQ